MSSTNLAPGSLAPPSSSSLSQAHSTHSQPQTPQAQNTKATPRLIPTNTVTLKDGTTVRVRIEPMLAVEDVVRQLCINVRIKDPPTMYALRDESDELVTNENLRKKIKAKVALK